MANSDNRGSDNRGSTVYSFLLVLDVWYVKPTSRKSWAENLLIWSDLTLGSFFKDK